MAEDPDDPRTETRLLIDDKQIENEKERGLRTGLRVVSVFDGVALVVIIVAILVQINNRDNYIFLLNIQHVLWWLVTIMLTSVAASKLWYNVYIGLTAVWLVMDSVSLIWRAVLLHECYDRNSNNSCRDFEIQSWFIIISNGVLIVTDIIFIILAVLLRRYVIEDRKAVKEFEDRCRQRQRIRPATTAGKKASCPETVCPIKPGFSDTRALVESSRNPATTTTTAAATAEDPMPGVEVEFT